MTLSAQQAWLNREARSAARRLVLAIALGLAAGMVLIVQAGLLSAIVHAVVFENRSLADVLTPLVFLPILMVIRFALAWVGENCGFQAAVRVKADLRMRLYTHLQQMGPQRLRTRSTGELAHQVVDGVEGLEAYFARFLPQAALAVLIPLAVLAFIFPLSLTSGLILLGTAPFIPLLMVLIGDQAEKLNQRQWRKLAILSTRFLDSLHGLTTLRTFNAGRREAQLIARITDQYRETTIAVLRVAFVSALVLEFLATMGMAVTAIFIGFRLLYGEMSFQSGFLILLLAPEFYLPLRSLGTQYHARLSAVAAAEGLLSIMNEPVCDEHRTAAIHPRWRSVALQLENLGFGYLPDRTILHRLHLEIPAGALAVIKGPSGAGKTTVLRLLLGSLAPDQGRVLVNGKDLADMDRTTWLAHVAWMPQTATIFEGTLQENMLLPDCAAGDPVDPAKLREAAALTGLDQDLAVLPDGWNTRLGEGGAGLSGGQRRRLVLTRAALKNAPLMLLDEPTAHLDAAGRQIVLDALQALAGRHTLVVASHDPDVLAAADRVVTLSPEEAMP